MAVRFHSIADGYWITDNGEPDPLRYGHLSRVIFQEGLNEPLLLLAPESLAQARRGERLALSDLDAVIADAEQLLAVLARARAELVASGHLKER